MAGCSLRPIDDALIAGIYDAALGAREWTEVLSELGACFGACAAVLGVKEVGRGWGIQVGVDPDIMRLFFERHAGRNPLAERAATAEVGTVMTDRSQMPKSEFLRTEFYGECLRPQGMHALLNLRAARGRRQAVADVCLVRDRRRDDFAADDVALLELLAPHLCRAVAVTMRLAEARAESQALTEALDRLPWAALVLDDSGALRFTNAAGAALLRPGGGLRLDPSGGLQAERGAETEALSRMTASALPGGPAPRAGHLRLRRLPPHPPLMVTAVPLRAAAAAVVGLAPIPSVLLLAVSSEMEVASASPEALRTAFGLTEAEAAVAQRIARGEGLPVVAAALGVSPSTARTHLKHTFDKTGTHRQAELAALLAHLALSVRRGTQES
jgi:DNA-binding CsgD family transcriptional regulator